MIPSIVPKEICDIEFPDTIEMEVPNDNKLFAIMDTALSLMLPEVKPKDVIPEQFWMANELGIDLPDLPEVLKEFFPRFKKPKQLEDQVPAHHIVEERPHDPESLNTPAMV